MSPINKEEMELDTLEFLFLIGNWETNIDIN
jgi:hypothetical protein